MAITVQPVDHREIMEQIKSLTVGHWQETEAGFSDSEPNPCAEVYDAMAAVGGLVAFSAMDGGEVIGYASAFVCRHPHYDMVIAHHDTLYLHPEHRAGTAGIRLMKALETEAARRGAVRMLWHAKPGSAFDNILIAKGYHVEETIYCKGI